MFGVTTAWMEGFTYTRRFGMLLHGFRTRDLKGMETQMGVSSSHQQ